MFDRQDIMDIAWLVYKDKGISGEWSFAECLHRSWIAAKMKAARRDGRAMA